MLLLTRQAEELQLCMLLSLGYLGANAYQMGKNESKFRMCGSAGLFDIPQVEDWGAGIPRSGGEDETLIR